MVKHDIFVIGSSLGGVEALSRIVARLPPHFPGSLFVVQHTSRHGDLAPVLAARARLSVRTPEGGERFEPGVIYVAPSDHHLLLEAKNLRVVHGPRENGCRPAIDPLFRSAAAYHGTRVVGIVLTGLRDDGAAGLRAIHRCGGLTIVQDPDEAAFPDMPRSALRLVPVDYVVRLSELPELMVRLSEQDAVEGQAPPEDIVREARITARYDGSEETLGALGPLTTLDCPECGGPLWQLGEGTGTRFRCRIGHAFSQENLAGHQAWQIERSLLVAMRALEERSRMLDRLAEQNRGHPTDGSHYAQDRDETAAHADVIRELLARLVI